MDETYGTYVDDQWVTCMTMTVIPHHDTDDDTHDDTDADTNENTNDYTDDGGRWNLLIIQNKDLRIKAQGSRLKDTVQCARTLSGHDVIVRQSKALIELINFR